MVAGEGDDRNPAGFALLGHIQRIRRFTRLRDQDDHAAGTQLGYRDQGGVNAFGELDEQPGFVELIGQVFSEDAGVGGSVDDDPICVFNQRFSRFDRGLLIERVRFVDGIFVAVDEHFHRIAGGGSPFFGA